jgi:hypothetical protein
MFRNVMMMAGAAALGAAVAIGVPAAGQAPHPSRPSAVRRQAAMFAGLADGHPDLNGIWQALNEANYDIEAHNARPALASAGPYGLVPVATVVALGAAGSVPPGLGVVEGGELPYRPDALAQKIRNQENWLTSDPEIKCYLPGVPRATYMPYPFQILQSQRAITIAYEYAGAVRDLYLKDPGPAPVDSWMGQSVAHWDKDTLVVDVTNLSDATWFDRAGNFHSDALHVTERYTRTGRTSRMTPRSRCQDFYAPGRRAWRSPASGKERAAVDCYASSSSKSCDGQWWQPLAR